MRDDDGRKLDHQTLEQLRLRAVDLVADGHDPRTVARTLGMHKHTVYGWVAAEQEGGRQAVTAPDQMKRLATGGLRRLQALPELVRGFFRDPDLAYIHAAH